MRYALLLALAAPGAAHAQPPAPAAPVAQPWSVGEADLSALEGRRLLVRAGFPERFAAALAAAEAGDVTAMTLVGIAYLGDDSGVPADHDAARRWSRRAADAGSARALRTLGSMAMHGLGTSADLPAALALFERAHRGGNMMAAADIAALLANGEGGVARDWDRAFALFREAAQAGVAHAHGGLALAYVNGDGTARDYAAAREAAWRGAEERDPTAQFVLAMILGNGLGIERDVDRADGWLQTATLDGSAEARARIGWDEETIARVRRWEDYARLVHRRLAEPPHLLRYDWEEPGRVLRLQYLNTDQNRIRTIRFTWADGAEAPVSDQEQWGIRVIGGRLYELVGGQVLARMDVMGPRAARLTYEIGEAGRPGRLINDAPLATLPIGQYEALLRAARDSRAQDAPAEPQPAGDQR